MTFFLCMLFELLSPSTGTEAAQHLPEQNHARTVASDSFHADVAYAQRIYEEYYSADDWTAVEDDARVWQLDSVLHRVLHAPEMATANYRLLFEGNSRVHNSPDGDFLVLYSPDIGAKFDAYGTLYFVYRNLEGRVTVLREEGAGLGNPKGVYQPDETKPEYLVLHNLYTNAHTQAATAYLVNASSSELQFETLEEATDGYLSIFEWSYDPGAKSFHYSYELFVPGYAAATEEEAARAEQNVPYEGWYDYQDGKFVGRSQEE